MLKKLVVTGLTILFSLTCFSVGLEPAQARLDELLSPDQPYLSAHSAPAANLIASTSHTHIVQRGDTLTGIAKKYGLDLETLAELNNLKDRNRIIKGQAILLPETNLAYKVVLGDTLSSIAKRFGCSLAELTGLNGLGDPNRLLAGQQILLPVGQGGGVAEQSEKAQEKQLSRQLSWPASGWISSPYGMRDGTMHEGLDIAADQGQPVLAAADGEVVFAASRGTYGNCVIVDHGDGLRTLYAHNSDILVSEGQTVYVGEIIALVGSTGRSTGPHLHFEVLLEGVPMDPISCLE